MLRSEIRTTNGLSTIYVEGKPIWPMFFCSRHDDDREYHRRLVEAGIKVWWPFCDTDWQRPGAFDELKAKADLILSLDPEALLMIRVSLNPPASWLRDNPGELVRFEDGSTSFYDPTNATWSGESAVRSAYNGIGDYSMASDRWVADACRALGDHMDRIEESSFGHRVMGYFLNAGGTEEWYYGKTQDRSRHCMGFSPAFERAFTRFLREKYRNDEEKLRRAWGDATATFLNPRIPTLEERVLSCSPTEYEIERTPHEADFGSFLDPDRSQRIADFHEAWNAGTGYSLLAFARFIKEKTEGKALVGAFYGCQGCVLYHDFGTSRTSMALESPDIDFLSAPTNYEDRAVGGGAGFTNPIDSMHLRGKCWINEDDNGTTLQSRERWARCLRTKSIAEDIDVMKRDFARDLCEDAYAWWFENSAVDRWWDHPDYFPVLRRMQEIAREHYEQGRSKGSGIACLYDEQSIWYTDNETCKDAFQLNRIYELPRVGAPVDHYFLEDILLPGFPAERYRVYVVFNAVAIDERKRAAFAEKLKRNGNVIIWVYAAGFIYPGRKPELSMDYASELAAMKLGATDVSHDLSWLLEPGAHPFVTGLSRSSPHGSYRRRVSTALAQSFRPGDAPVLHPSLGRPLFTVRDPDATVLGRFTGGGEPAVAVKELGSWTSVYVGSKVVSATLIRNAARATGVHIYGDADDVLYANDRYLAIHPCSEGERTLVLPRRARRVTEVFDDVVVAEGEDRLRLSVRLGGTLLFRIDYGDEP